MPGTIVDWTPLFAQAGKAAGKAAANDPGGLNGFASFMPLIVVAALWFYLLILRPQQKQDRQRKDLLAGLKKNERVLTSAGIFGTVVSVQPEQDTVVVRIDDDRGVKVTFSRASIVRIIDGPDEKAKDKDRASKEKAAETA